MISKLRFDFRTQNRISCFIEFRFTNFIGVSTVKLVELSRKSFEMATIFRRIVYTKFSENLSIIIGKLSKSNSPNSLSWDLMHGLIVSG